MSYTVSFCPRSRRGSKRMDDRHRQTPHLTSSGARILTALSCLILLSALLVSTSSAQDWVRTGSGLGVDKVRLAVPDFKAANTDPQNEALLKTFNDTFWNDLDNSGVVELVSKSFYPLQVPGQPAEVTFNLWNVPPPNAAMLAFGNLGVAGGKLTVQGWLYDVKNTASPQVLGKQYSDVPTDAAARLIAHKFADEIIFRLGGGIPGIAESEIYFVSDRSGHKEIWAMDYDGSNQRQLTHLGSVSLSPRISPDGSRLAFSSLGKTGWDILMFSIDLNRLVSFPHFGGTNLSPAWSPDGTRLALSSSRGGTSEIYVCDASGGNLRPHNGKQRSGRFSRVESQDRSSNRFRQRQHWLAPGLHHGGRRHQPTAYDGPGLRRPSWLVAQWPIPYSGVDSQIRPRRARLLATFI